MTNQQIKEVALAAGFKLKQQPDGSQDLNPYVYDFARKLVAELERDRDQLSVLLKAAGIYAKNIKAENAALEVERDRLKVELDNCSHEPEMTASDAYHHCADLIEPHVVDMPHGTECNDQSLCRSVCGSLAYLIEHWRGTARRDARMKAEALEEVSMLYPSGVGAEFDSIRADLQGCAHNYRKQAEGES